MKYLLDKLYNNDNVPRELLKCNVPKELLNILIILLGRYHYYIVYLINVSHIYFLIFYKEYKQHYNLEILFKMNLLYLIIVEPEPDTLLQVSIRHCIMLTYNSLENIK